MKFFTDLHLHSRYSRATSKNLDLEHLWLWAQLKGIQVVGTGDFTHPAWMKELEEKLEPAEDGLYTIKESYVKSLRRELPPACQGLVRFMCTVEISSIYKRLDKVRKVHNCVFAPSLAVAKSLQSRLGEIGNIGSDGRPILGLDSRDLLEIVLDSDPLSYLIPAHIWTPWFSAMGSKSGFDRMTDCFGDLSDHIFAVETGLSSDPPMNWRLSQLDPYVLVSNGDAHSPQKLAREATIFDTELSYAAIYRALKDREDDGLVGTVEFFPDEGKYHYDGCRNCQQRMHPKDTIAAKGVCPVCGKAVTVGVMARVEELADHSEGRKSPNWRPYYSLIPLPEVIADVRGVGPNSKSVQRVYYDLLARLGNELHILFDVPLGEISRVGGRLLAEAIRRMRAGQVDIKPGYDGEFGQIHLLSAEDRQQWQEQEQLSVF